MKSVGQDRTVFISWKKYSYGYTINVFEDVTEVKVKFTLEQAMKA
jgi:hypothetical protein